MATSVTPLIPRAGKARHKRATPVALVPPPTVVARGDTAAGGRPERRVELAPATGARFVVPSAERIRPSAAGIPGSEPPRGPAAA